MEIINAELKHLKYIKSLSNKESKSIGFIPQIAYESAITGKKKSIHRWSDTCNDRVFICEENNEPVGFIMMSYGKISKVNQICIQQDARLFERGKKLLRTAIEHGLKNGIYDFGCGCADDLESNVFWSIMGWSKVSERKGISYHNTWKQTSNRKINIYRYQELSLFKQILMKENI
jgi:hypothetical protein